MLQPSHRLIKLSSNSIDAYFENKSVATDNWAWEDLINFKFDTILKMQETDWLILCSSQP